jgi:coenzyme F420-reducing hydrogenase gamma subunit
LKYLNVDPKVLKVAFFDFTCCEGCQLQIVNKEDTLADFLQYVEIINFREISSYRGENFDIAFIEGAISRKDELERLEKIREQAEVIVAYGSCACFGGVNQLKNSWDINSLNKEVYGNFQKDTLRVRKIKDIVKVDFEIPGCPVSKAEIEKIVQHLSLGIPFSYKKYPVCVECKHRFITCLYDFGEICLGPVTKAGCDATCPANRTGCWGCRGPADEANTEYFIKILKEKKFKKRDIEEKLSFFGAFEDKIDLSGLK